MNIQNSLVLKLMNSIDIKLTYPDCQITYQVDLVNLTANVVSSIGDKHYLSSVGYVKLPDKVKRMVECMRGECE